MPSTSLSPSTANNFIAILGTTNFFLLTVTLVYSSKSVFAAGDGLQTVRKREGRSRWCSLSDNRKRDVHRFGQPRHSPTKFRVKDTRYNDHRLLENRTPSLARN